MGRSDEIPGRGSIEKMNETYIRILIDSLEQKNSILDQVMILDQAQTKIVSDPNPDLNELDQNAREIGELAEKLNLLDNGFEKVYAHVREELSNNRESHRDEILRLKELISEVTEKSVKIQAEEAMNRDRAKRCFDEKRKSIGGKRKSVNAASAYSMNMRSAAGRGDSFFLDKTK